ncbi:TRAP transporter small permease subunit [Psychromonas sp. SP041]|uniref:TRAP transporter small permease subunit n=1 Tax=Psychromonas sp. SP041 TaxID=1365007 RepID=UPI0004139EF2|nr:TRAP transporter small permease subunit [Psychromonas sp. SP041]
MIRIISFLKKINNGIAVIAGLALLACITLIILDIVLREIGISFSGSEEISGYVMAAVTSWGVCYGLTVKAHVRIDFLREKGNLLISSLFDLIALAALSYVAVYLAYYAIPVLSKTLKSGALSNTAMEIPLYLPQSIWLAGWIWFAISSSVLLIISIILVIQGKYEIVDKNIGTGGDL